MRVAERHRLRDGAFTEVGEAPAEPLTPVRVSPGARLSRSFAFRQAGLIPNSKP